MLKSGKGRQEKLRNLLEERKRKVWGDLRAELFGRMGDEYSKEFEKAMDLGDLSSIDELQNVGINLVNMRQQELAKLKQAERKLDEGTYGICDECGGEISEERLAALPYALRCLRCEQQKEKAQVRDQPVRIRRDIED